MNRSRLSVHYLRDDIDVSSLVSYRAVPDDAVRIERYWSGSIAPPQRRCAACLLWSASALYVRFEAAVGSEDLIVSEKPVLTEKTLGLWNRDVCEIFLAPDRAYPNRYFEFEIAPTGEWLDLAIDWTAEGRQTDTNYSSGVETAAKLERNMAVMCLKIRWGAFGRAPSSGDIWLGNLFRCVGEGPDRGYLAWLPTETEKPNFHVPGRFGELQFMP